MTFQDNELASIDHKLKQILQLTYVAHKTEVLTFTYIMTFKDNEPALCYDLS